MHDENQTIKEQTLATIDKIGLPIFSGIILPFITTNPIFQASILSAYGLFGVYMQYNQNRVNNFMQILKDNPGIFTKEIVQTEEFKNGFLIIFEEYIKERNKEKREIIKNIFLGFTKLSDEEKEKFELERLLDVTKKICSYELEIMKDIKKNPIIMSGEKNLKKISEMDSIQHKEFLKEFEKAEDNNDFEKKLELIKNKSIFNKESKNIILTTNNDGIPDIDILTGLSGLGIVKKTNSPYKVNSEFVYTLTYLGEKFIDYIKNYDS